MVPTALNRRQAGTALLGAALTTAMPRSALADSAKAPAPPTLDFVFEAVILLAPPVELGTIDGERRRLVPITGGTVDGPRLRGIVLPGGGDWQGIGKDRTVIHARYTLEAADGTRISIDNPGVRVASPEIIARLTAGEDLDPSLYYFRTTPTFEVQAGPHDWMTRSVFVGQGIRHPGSVVMRYFRVT
ncbi:MAG: hypothetical protein JWN66_1271 [Sphingomonas bacterium]|nr:hypothetical protein [Sphingomonas bacterium]